MNAPTSVAQSRDVLPMSVANMTFLVNRLGEDCSPLQYIRELTKNAEQAVTLSGVPGEIVWDVNWTHYELDPVYKLSCIDTGVGMTGPEMVDLINKLSSSLHEQAASKNFGVGAKIAAAPRNPHGVIYMSWKGGAGSMVWLHFDLVANVYGLKRWPENDGEFWTPISDEVKPKPIDQHGTMVTLLGKSDDHNTMEAPTGTPMKSRWILRYLNTRFFRFPANVTVRAREGWELPRSNSKHNFLRVVEGQERWLDKNADTKGVVTLSDAEVLWWILGEGVDRDSGHNAPGGHVAALYQDELYELVSGRAGIARLQSFGAIFGTDRIVVYVKPLSAAVTANTSRTNLLIDGEPLDWARWAAEFRANLPDAIVTLQEEIGARSGEKDHRKAISERLKQINELLRFSRFKPAGNGVVLVEESESSGVGGEPAQQRKAREGSGAGGTKGGRSGDIYALFTEGGSTPANPVEADDQPKTRWVSAADGTRTPPDLDDRAAKYHPEQNLILINGDFRVFTDMIDRWKLSYSHVAGSDGAIKEVVHEWFEQQLVEAVMSALSLRKAGKWSLQEIENLWSEHALTTAVLPRWHIDQSIKRHLGQRLGTLKLAVPAA